MYQEITEFLAETLFYILDGFPIVDTLFFIPYIFLIALIISIPFVIFTYYHLKLPAILNVWMLSFGVIIGITLFSVTISIGYIQMQHLRECEIIQLVVSSDKVNEQKMFFTQCRSKDNYYGEFGDWKIYK
jgi:hypothetical protein